MNFFYKESKPKKIGKGEKGKGWGRGTWTDRQTGPHQFAPLTSSSKSKLKKRKKNVFFSGGGGGGDGEGARVSDFYFYKQSKSN